MESQEAKIHYKVKVSSVPKSRLRGGTTIIKLTGENINEYPGILKNCIDRFNSEVDWDGMWTVEEAEERLSSNHIAFVLIDSTDTILSFVWFTENYLYNAFSHSDRVSGDTVKFIKRSCSQLDSSIKEIKLYCDDWNVKAQQMFKKVGFERYTPFI
jgi:hypothetical protein